MAFQKQPQLLQTGPVTCFTDHKLLIWIFNGAHPSKSKLQVGRSQRWAVFLGQFVLLVLHIAGVQNVVTDLFSRYLRDPDDSSESSSLPRQSRQLLTAASASSGAAGAAFESPAPHLGELPSLVTLPALILAQNTALALLNVPTDALSFYLDADFDEQEDAATAAVEPSPPPRYKQMISRPSEDSPWIVCFVAGHPYWIPEDKALKIRLLVLAHGGLHGHKGLEATLYALRGVWWPALRADARTFINRCLLCLDGKLGVKVPRPFASTIHARRFNSVIHTDYLYVGPSALRSSDPPDLAAINSLLVVHCDLTHVCLLYEVTGDTAEQACRGLMQWIGAYGVFDILVTDGPSHFRNQLVEELTRHLGVQHTFSLAHCPWTNGGGERLHREVLRTFKALLNTVGKPPTAWRDIVPAVQLALNIHHRPTLGFSPIELAFGPSTAVLTPSPFVLLEDAARSTGWSLEPIDSSALKKYVSSLAMALEEKWAAAYANAEKVREQGRARESKGVMPAFMPGEYVLVANVLQKGKAHKLASIWHGPFMVMEVLSPHQVRVKHLVTGAILEEHITRLRFYSDSQLEKTTDLVSTIAQLEHSGRYIVESFAGVEKQDGIWHAIVKWKDFDEIDNTSEPLTNLIQDLNMVTVREYLKQLALTKTQKNGLNKVFPTLTL
jgi:hypothetical protein